MKGCALGRILHPVGAGQDPELIKKAVFRPVDPGLKGFLSLGFDEFIRILVGTQIDHG